MYPLPAMKETTLPIYAQAVDELNLQTYDRGLYGKALCDANGEESLARVYYIRARVASILKTNKVLEKETEVQKNKGHLGDAHVNRFRVRRRRSATSRDEMSEAPLESTNRPTFRFRRSYDSMVNLFVRWTAL